MANQDKDSNAPRNHSLRKKILSFWWLAPTLAMLWPVYQLTPSHRKDASALLDQSGLNAENRHYPECIALARAALKMRPDLPGAYTNIGYCQWQMGNQEEGLRSTREALRLRPNYKAAMKNLAWMSAQQQNANGTKVITADTLVDRALRYSQAEQYQECIDAARQALQLRPESVEAFNNVGWCSAKLGRWDEGIRNEQEALRLQPGYELARNNLAWMQQEKGKAGGAAAATADSYLNASLEHAQAHRYQECIDAARQALKLRPDWAYAYNNLGWCAASMGRLDEGIRNLQEAVRLQPDYDLARNNLATFIEQKKRGRQ